MSQLILASSSIYRQQLLKQLGIPFISLPPQVDETVIANETPVDLVRRLSISKANKIAKQHTKSIVIGSDQIAVFNDKIIGKPHNFENAQKQLTYFSGNTIDFLTGVAIVCLESKKSIYELSKVRVKFRCLREQEIIDYLNLDKPFDCAGSFKIEANGIRLFEYVKSDDPTSLQGLPLMTVNRMLSSLCMNLA